MDWIEAYDDQNQLYYYNNSTGEMSWDPPSEWNQVQPLETEQSTQPTRTRRGAGGGRSLQYGPKSSLRNSQSKSSRKPEQETYTKKEFKANTRRLEGLALEEKTKTRLALSSRNALRAAVKLLMSEMGTRNQEYQEKYETVAMFAEENSQRKDTRYTDKVADLDDEKERHKRTLQELEIERKRHKQTIEDCKHEMQNLHDHFASKMALIVSLKKETKTQQEKIDKMKFDEQVTHSTTRSKINELSEKVRHCRCENQLLKHKQRKTLGILVALWISNFGTEMIYKLPPYLVQFIPKIHGMDVARRKREDKEAIVIQNMCRGWLSIRKMRKFKKVVEQKLQEERERLQFEKLECPLKMGQGVLANYGGEGAFYPATIVRTFSVTNTYNIEYNDGDAEEGVARKLLKPLPIFKTGDKIEALYNEEGDEWFPGTVTLFYTDDFKVDVAYNDGDNGRRMRHSCVRYLAGEGPVSDEDDEVRSELIIDDENDAKEENNSHNTSDDYYDESEETDGDSGSSAPTDADDSDEEKNVIETIKKRRKRNITRVAKVSAKVLELSSTHGVPDSSFAKLLIEATSSGKSTAEKALADANAELKRCRSLIERSTLTELKEMDQKITALRNTLEEATAIRSIVQKRIQDKIKNKDLDEWIGEKDEKIHYLQGSDKRRNIKLDNANEIIVATKAKLEELFHRRRKMELVIPTDLVWAKIISKSLNIFNKLENTLNQVRKDFFLLYESYIGMDMSAETHQLKTVTEEQVLMLKWDAENPEEIEEEEEPDFGPDINPREDALAATKKKMKLTAPHLDTSSLENNEVLVDNPDFIPDELLGPEEDPADPARAPKMIMANLLPEYQIFMTMLEKTVSNREKKKQKRQKQIDLWNEREKIRKTKEAQAKLDKKRIEDTAKIEDMYQNQRLTLKCWLNEAVQRAIRAEQRARAASAQQSAAARRHILTITKEMEKILENERKLENESMDIEDICSSTLSKLDFVDNALHFPFVQQNLDLKIQKLRQTQSTICEEYSRLINRKRALIFQLEDIQDAETLRQTALVKDYDSLKSALTAAVQQYRRTDIKWKFAELCNRMYHSQRIKAFKERIVNIHYLCRSISKSIEKMSETPPKEPEEPPEPIIPEQYMIEDSPVVSDSEANNQAKEEQNAVMEALQKAEREHKLEMQKRIQDKYEEDIASFKKAMQAYISYKGDYERRKETFKYVLATSTVGLQDVKESLRQAEIASNDNGDVIELKTRRKDADQEMIRTKEILLLCHCIGIASDARALSKQQFNIHTSESFHLFMLNSAIKDAELNNRRDLYTAKRELESLKKQIIDTKFEYDLERDVMKGRMKVLNVEINAIRGSSREAMKFLRGDILKKQEAMEEERRKMQSTIRKMALDFSKKETALKASIKEKQEIIESKTKWIKAMQTDMQRHRKETNKYKDETEKYIRQQAQVHSDAMRQIFDKNEHLTNHAHLVNFLESKIEKLGEVIEDLKLDAINQKAVFEVHKATWRREVWRRDESIRVILTNTDEFIHFFCDAVDRLAGRSQLLNDKLRENCVIQILLALCHSPHVKVKRMAVRSIGRMAWNGTADEREVNYLAREMWNEWTTRIANKLEYDLQKEAQSWQDKLADIKEKKGLWAAAGKASRAIARKNILAMRLVVKGPGTTELFQKDSAYASKFCNVSVQESIGSISGSLQTILNIARNTHDIETQKFACDVLAIASLHKTNGKKMLLLENFVPTMLTLLDDDKNGEVRSKVASALGNLSYNDAKSTINIGNQGAIESLTSALITSEEIDVLLSVSAALINLLYQNIENRIAFLEAGGVEAGIRICKSHISNSCPELQASISELLVNVTCLQQQALEDHVLNAGVQPIILLCASRYETVQVQAGLIMGNLSLHNGVRKALVDSGGVPALLILVDNNDSVVNVVVNGLWALGNLVWNTEAQDMCGKYMKTILKLCQSSNEKIQENALQLLGNMVYFHEGNRRRMLENNFGGGEIFVKLLKYCGNNSKANIVRNCARILGTSSHDDSNAIYIAELGGVDVLIRLCRHSSPDVQEVAVWALGNMAVHDGLKRVLLDAGVIEAITKLHVSQSKKVRRATMKTMAILDDLVEAYELNELKRDKGTIPLIIDMLRDPNPTFQEAAAEGLAHESWIGKKNAQDKIMEFSGIDSLVRMLDKSQHPGLVLRSLWAIRNVVYNNKRNQDRVSTTATSYFAKLLSDDNMDIVEATIMCLIGITSDNSQSCRHVISTCLQQLIMLIEGRTKHAELASNLLKIIGPYNYLLCSACGWRNEGGIACIKCGSETKFFVVKQKLNDETNKKLHPTGKTKLPMITTPETKHERRKQKRKLIKL